MDAAFWSAVFESAQPESGAAEPQLQQLLTSIQEIMPFRGLPESYLAFLRWSNGGTFRNGIRNIAFWHCGGPRRMMDRFHFAEFAPLIVPFASNPGTGDWYGFDTSSEPVAGEFPVVYIDHEIMRERLVLAPTFLDFCRGTEDPEKLYWDWWRTQHRNG